MKLPSKSIHRRSHQNHPRYLYFGLSLAIIAVVCTTVYGVIINSSLNRPASSPAALIVEAPIAPDISTPEEWLAAINIERHGASVTPLAIDQRLNASALKKAVEISEDGWNYDNPHLNAAGVVDGPKMALRTMPECEYVSENLVKTSNIIIGIQSLMGSPSHRAAIVASRYEFVGIGSVPGYTVMHFGDCY